MVLSTTFNRWLAGSYLAFQFPMLVRQFRSDAALEAIRKASENKTPNLVVYNYPSFSGAYGALFSHLYHSRVNVPCLILPFSAVAPFSVDDLCIDGMKTCYFLDFLGPKGFALELSRKTSATVVGFDHRKSVLSRISPREDFDVNLKFYVDIEKSSSTAAYEYFSDKLSETRFNNDDSIKLLNHEDQERVEKILRYIEDGDLRKWSLPNIRAFNIGIKELRSRLNCITNQYMYQQLIEMCTVDLITKGNTYLSSRQTDANNLLHKVFRLQLGRGFYGECLGVRGDGHSDLSDEMGKELSQMSAAAGLSVQIANTESENVLNEIKFVNIIVANQSSIGISTKLKDSFIKIYDLPIGAVVYMQRNNLKMCLRTTDSSTDTSEIAKAYGGGGSPSSSSFIIRMDEYNQWLSVLPSLAPSGF